MAHHLDRVGQQMGDYRLLRWLGGGSFGQVYLAEQVRDHTQVAIKLLGIQLSRNEELKAFINEARMICLNHVNIVPLLDFGISQEEVPFLVMEYVAQGTLRDRYPQGSQLPLPLVVSYAQQVGSALQYAHERHLIHRDVKPENMLLRADGTVLLSDFGLVTVVHSSPSLRSHQEMGGTVPYMAPEQIQKQARAASDQYSLGVVVYEWIAGRHPFEGSPTEVAVQHLMKPPPSLVAQVPTLSRGVEEVVLKALAKDPRDRFVCVQDFTVALEQAVWGPLAIPDVYKTVPINNNELVILPSTNLLPTSSSPLGLTPKPRVDWNDALSVPNFYGREEEQASLSRWVMQEHCHVISVLGMGGIGKSALVMRITLQLMKHFDVVIVRSLRNAPSCEALLDDCLQVLSPQPISTMSATLEQRISYLLSLMCQMRALIVLDNLEGLLEANDVRGHLRPGFEGYGQLLRKVAERDHQSCLLLTSREKSIELRLLESNHSQVHSLRLTGLDTAACKQLLEEKAVVGTSSEQEHLIAVYAGNPLALQVVAVTILDLFKGEIGPFLADSMMIFHTITDLLNEQLARLSSLEQSVLYWLAIMREPVTFHELLELLVIPPPRAQVLEAVDAGYRRSLIERGKRSGSFTLQSVVLEYVTDVLLAEASSEIQQGQLHKLIQYGLSQAHAKEYVRQTQERLLVTPLFAELKVAYPKRDELEMHLLSLLDQLRTRDASVQGYGPANLIALLRQRGHLNRLDFSHLAIRGVYLQGIEMHDTSLAGSLIHDTVWTSAVSATRAVVISLDGKWWAASGMQGKVCLWDEGGQTLQYVWQAHTDIVQALAFSPDGRTLASGSLDGSVKLWDVEACSHGACPRDALLCTVWQHSPQSLAFSPDGSLLATCGPDATVRIWSTGSHEACPRGTNLQTLTHPGSVFTIAWCPDGQLLASSCIDGAIRLWKRRQTALAISVEPLLLQTSWVTSPATHLAFAPDGRTLASANQDWTITLWEMSSGCLLYALPGRTDHTNSVLWSPDGRTLATSSHENAIWLWDVAQGRRRAMLSGHTAEVNSIAFTPDSNRLLSCSADCTLRVWDVENGQCVRVTQGYAVSLYGIDWSPDGTHLVSGGTDELVTVWDLSGSTSPRVLRGHSKVVWGVEWSPDGRYLASRGDDTAVVCLWDPIAGTCIQSFQEPSTILLGVAWSQDGGLLVCGINQQGMQVWDVVAGSLRWTGQTHPMGFLHVAWSPDGTRLVGGSEDGCIYLWDIVNGTEQAQGIEQAQGTVPTGLLGHDGQAQGTVPTGLLGHHGRITSMAWSRDGMWLASGSDNEGSGELFVWDMQSVGAGATTSDHLNNPGPSRSFVGRAGTISALAWSPGGDLLVSGGGDGLLRWWDVQKGESVSMRVAHQGTIRSLRVSPDGRCLASCGDDGAVMIWDLWSSEHLQTLRHDRPYERLNITGIKGVTETQRVSLQALGAIEETML